MTKDGRATVMVVEDSPAFMPVLELIIALETDADLVYIARTGEEALQAFSLLTPDLVLLDYQLPGINGLEVARRIKKQRPATMLAMVTAYDEKVQALLGQDDRLIVEVIPKTQFSLGALQRLVARVRNPGAFSSRDGS
jgi:CheY-like chemotaxis protein